MKKKWLFALGFALCLLPVPVMAAEEATLYVGGVELPVGQYLDSDGNLGAEAPGGGVNRAQMAQMLWNLEGCPVVNYAMSFTDVGEGWESVRWAVSEGYMQGYGDGSFGLGDELTREQLAAILYRYAQKQGGGFTGSWMFLLDCADRAEVSPWAYEAVCWMNMHGIINGKGGYIAPKDMVTNAEAAAIWMRYLEQ